jgi:glycerol-1-phosphate dehydrogenase [NAD(P)+]
MSYLHKTDWERVRDTLSKLEAPTSACELNVSEKDIVKALEMAATIRPERYTILNKQSMNQETCEELAKATQVI